MITFYTYPKCSTCQKAKKWLESNKMSFEEIHIVNNTPDKETLKRIYQKSGHKIDKLFNKNGIKYRELKLKDKIQTIEEDEALELLSSDGMLIKRPIIENTTKAIIGFNEKSYEDVLKNS